MAEGPKDGGGADEIKAEFQIDSPYSPVLLYTGELIIPKVGSGNGKVWLKWLPHPHYWFEISEFQPKKDSAPVSIDGLEIAFPEGTSAVPAALRIEWCGELAGPVELGAFDDVESVVFHLVNLTLAPRGRRQVEYDEEPLPVGRLRFSNAGCYVEIDPVVDYEDRIRALGEEGGYAITWVGRVRKIPRFPFPQEWNAETVVALIESIQLPASFISGGWCWPALLVGRNAAGETVWQKWNDRRVSSGRGKTAAWAQRLHVNAASDLLSSLSRGEDEDDNSLHRALSWYLEAYRDPRADSAIVRCQIGLEALSWEILKDVVSEDAIGRLSAANQIKLALTLAQDRSRAPGLPSEDEYAHVVGFAKGKNMTSGVDVVTAVRNDIIHWA